MTKEEKREKKTAITFVRWIEENTEYDGLFYYITIGPGAKQYTLNQIYTIFSKHIKTKK